MANLKRVEFFGAFQSRVLILKFSCDPFSCVSYSTYWARPPIIALLVLICLSWQLQCIAVKILWERTCLIMVNDKPLIWLNCHAIFFKWIHFWKKTHFFLLKNLVLWTQKSSILSVIVRKNVNNLIVKWIFVEKRMKRYDILDLLTITIR